MKQLLDDGKIFSCGCQKWRITPKDLTNKTPDLQDLLLHDCEKIQVYQKHKSINRLFIRKNEP